MSRIKTPLALCSRSILASSLKSFLVNIFKFPRLGLRMRRRNRPPLGALGHPRQPYQSQCNRAPALTGSQSKR